MSQVPRPCFFDCPLCCLPLKPPVLQCRNAHAACSGCAASRSNKCASCGGVYEHIHWLDSYHLAAKVRCPNEAYGCLSWVPYCMPDDHQLVCAYKPCCCPEPGCIFSGSLPTLRDHLASQHADKDVLQSIWRIKPKVHRIKRAKVHAIESICWTCHWTQEEDGNKCGNPTTDILRDASQ